MIQRFNALTNHVRLSAEHIRIMGDKIEAKRTARSFSALQLQTKRRFNESRTVVREDTRADSGIRTIR